MKTWIHLLQKKKTWIHIPWSTHAPSYSVTDTEDMHFFRPRLSVHWESFGW
jgi:hypothetical protein